MEEYLSHYIVFGTLFLAGTLGFWVVTRPLRDPSAVYETKTEVVAASTVESRAP